MKIIYLEHSGIGNAILSTPMLQAIKSLGHEIHVCCWPRNYEIYQSLDFCDFLTMEHPINYMSRHSQFDYLMISPVGAVTHPDMAKYTRNILSNSIKPPWMQHEIEVKIKFAYDIGYSGPIPSPQIELTEFNWEFAQDFIKKYNLDNFICINASYLKSDHWHLKHWGNNNYIKLLYDFQYYLPEYKVVLIGDKTDSQNAEYIISTPNFFSQYPFNKEKIINACGISNQIKDTAAIIQRSKLVVGNDSGLAHIAAALNIPTITIFTFTSVIKNKPWGPKAHIVSKPCEKRLMCQHGNYNKCECLNVPYQDVWQTVDKIITSL